VKIDPRYFRPSEVDLLLSDPTKAKKTLGWEPKIGFEELVKRMVESDLELAAREKRARG
jgi:GDPmannose 4,6-dehydratase